MGRATDAEAMASPRTYRGVTNIHAEFGLDGRLGGTGRVGGHIRLQLNKLGRDVVADQVRVEVEIWANLIPVVPSSFKAPRRRCPEVSAARSGSAIRVTSVARSPVSAAAAALSASRANPYRARTSAIS